MTEAAASQETHYFDRAGWLRASVLGANDGIVSTASLIAGVASAGVPASEVLLAGTAGLVAGAMSMAAGEYVSVSSQADSEKSDLAREEVELRLQPEFERQELADIYVRRGLDPDLARQVAEQMMARDALATHARDELGITVASKPRPISGCALFGGLFHGGRGFAVGGGDRIAAALDRYQHDGRIGHRTGSSGRCLGVNRWCARHPRRNAGHVLGSSGDGGNGACRLAFWHHDFINLNVKPTP